MSPGELTDAQWKRLSGLLAPRRPDRGRPNMNIRLVVDGICGALRTGGERQGSCRVRVFSRCASAPALPVRG
ncbi:transposase [Corallococcus sp. AB018]|nr:transposase [Corallococcus sp. AB018]